MKNLVGYVRVSSASQKDNTSIEMQVEKIKMYCELHNINLIKIFEDDGLSAKNTNRNSYKEMIKFVTKEENNIDAIIVYKNDRLHRSLYELLGMIEHIQKYKVDLISITEMFDTSTAQGMLFLQMLGSFSEFERKLINERTYSGRMQKGEKNLYAGGRVAFGYTLIDGERLTLNYEEAEIVKDVFKMRCKGSSLDKIAKKYQTSRQRVHYILKNKIYIGKYNYDGKLEQNKISFTVPRIVTDYTYNKANSINIKTKEKNTRL